MFEGLSGVEEAVERDSRAARKTGVGTEQRTDNPRRLTVLSSHRLEEK